MSDLCYNCGDCHLPQPCKLQLKRCDICLELGHTYNFCPLGVRNKDPNYQYWALCNNCDRWHLPTPCASQLHTCAECKNRGHLEFFCPVNAWVRKTAALTRGVELAGVKRQRVDEDHAAPEQKYVHQDVVRQIKTDAMNQVFYMINQGANHHEIVYSITQPRVTSQGTSVETPISNESARTHPSGHQAVFSTGTTPQITKSQIEQSFSQVVTPTPANFALHLTGGLKNEPDVGIPALNAPKSTEGPQVSLAISATGEILPREEQEPHVPISPSTKTEQNAATAPKKAKKAPVKKCAACRRAHKRCPHFATAADDNPHETAEETAELITQPTENMGMEINNNAVENPEPVNLQHTSASPMAVIQAALDHHVSSNPNPSHPPVASGDNVRLSPLFAAHMNAIPFPGYQSPYDPPAQVPNSEDNQEAGTLTDLGPNRTEAMVHDDANAEASEVPDYVLKKNGQPKKKTGRPKRSRTLRVAYQIEFATLLRPTEYGYNEFVKK